MRTFCGTLQEAGLGRGAGQRERAQVCACVWCTNLVLKGSREVKGGSDLHAWEWECGIISGAMGRGRRAGSNVCPWA